ncbi:PAS domain S-box protein [Spongiibacter sp. KMU-158]|uniref:histidine kinase n=1 Tax=Spongiibacter pelagi TaxID=2760804 RepID=A0A927BYW4_9GAMM|nr:ATP-binding protein [Spongiibacter pelagi]MBD2858105.1 PAS domain S-box protein [Spongiibacter pelagi]
MKKLAFRKKIYVITLACALVPLTIMAGWSWSFVNRLLLNNAVDEVNTLVNAKNSFLQDHLEQLRISLNLLASDASTREAFAHYLENRQHDAFGEIQNQIDRDLLNHIRDQKLYDLFFINTEGGIFFSVKNENDRSTNLFSGPYQHTGLAKVFLTALKGTTDFSSIEEYQPSKRPAFFMAAPVTLSGAISGVIAVQFNIDAIVSIINTESDDEALLESYLLTSQDKQVKKLYTDPNRRDPHLHDIDAEDSISKLLLQAGKNLQQLDYEEVYQADDELILFRPIPTIDAVLVNHFSSQKLFNQQNQVTLAWLSGFGLALLLTLPLANFLIRQLLDPISKLAKSSLNIQKGNYFARVHIDSNDELGELAKAFNEMAAVVENQKNWLEQRVAQRTQALSKLNQELEGYRNELENRVQEKTASLNAVLNGAGDGILTTDSVGNLLSFNASAERIFGYSAEELLGVSVTTLMPDVARPQHSAHFRNFTRHHPENDFVLNRTVPARHKNGTIFSLSISVSAIKTGSSADTETRFIGVCRDVTKQKQAEDELHKAKQDAELANAAKTAFLANISHEIRTPMNAMLGFSELLIEDPQLSEKHHGQAKTIHTAASSLMAIINDILDMSKLESGKINIETLAFDLPKLIQESTTLLSHSAAIKQLEFNVSIDPKIPEFVLGDPTRIRQVLLNLLSNAIKFTEKGSISLSIKQSHNVVQFDISDTGIGISPAQIPNVFDRFSQADISTTRRFGGSGLGTTISKELVELMGGQIWVESEVGKGSVFSFSLPLQAASNAHLNCIETKSLNIQHIVQSMEETVSPERGLKNTPDTVIKEPTTVDHASLIPLIDELKRALGQLDPDEAIPALKPLLTFYSKSELEPIYAAIEDFDFERASQALHSLQASTNHQSSAGS